MTSSQSERPTPGFDFAGFADGLMAAGDRLAEKLRDVDDSPWTQQILDEWAEAKNIAGLL